MNQPRVDLIAYKTRAVEYLRHPARLPVLKARLAMGCDSVALIYARAIREAVPDLPANYELDIVDMVRASLKSERPRVTKRLRGEAA